MNWPSVIGGIAYYLVFPCLILFNLLLAFLAPLTHLVSYIWHGFLFPLNLLGRFETLYVYFGVAAIIGLLTGSILHLSATLLISLLNLQPSPKDAGHKTTSVLVAQDKMNPSETWRVLRSTEINRGRTRLDGALEGEYKEFLDKDRERRREWRGLLSQTILEEDDDSED